MTINQRTRIKRNKLKKTTVQEVSLGKPQIKGLVLKVLTMTPKKPNSALRKIAKVKVKLYSQSGSTKQSIVIAYIPGINHTLSTHNLVLIHPGRTQDLPGIKYKIIRGVLDAKW
jgi:small subunit ribosomal protein S12